jgi:hypothetical protein
MKIEVIERAQEARVKAEIEKRPVEFERTDYLLPDFTPDWDWMWTIAALALWAIFAAGIGFGPVVTLVGAVVIVFTWRKRRPWLSEYNPRWRGWPGL